MPGCHILGEEQSFFEWKKFKAEISAKITKYTVKINMSQLFYSHDQQQLQQRAWALGALEERCF